MNICTYVCPGGIFSVTFSWLALLKNVKKKNHIIPKFISFEPHKKLQKITGSELCPGTFLQFV